MTKSFPNPPSPCLKSAVSQPLHQLEQRLIEEQINIETWLRKEWQKTPAPFTCSVDLRNAGFKLAPVDTNLFPAGFNNLGQNMLPLCIQAAQSVLEMNFPGCDRVLIIPENHTRNTFYWESLATFADILQKAGFAVHIGPLAPVVEKATVMTLPSERHVTLEPVTRQGDTLYVSGIKPCIVVLNHDLSEGAPEILHNITQPLLPSLALGWSTRTKSQHFRHYDHVATEFSTLLKIDPWLINPLFEQCGEINFVTREGEDCLAAHVDKILASIRQKYAEYGIDHKPFVIVKADAGTYGMGVMTVENSEQIYQLNRKERTKMAISKGKKTVSQVLIQEGVHSFETWGEHNAVAEPVVYMLGHHVVGGFYRMHKNKGINDSLNAPGMEFEPLPFIHPCNNPDLAECKNEIANRFYAYGVIARLALLAAAREAKEVS